MPNMATVTPSNVLAPEPRSAEWRLPTRIAFRFCFVYFSLYCVATQILNSVLAFPYIDFPELDTVWPLRQVIAWTAAHIFRVHRELVFTGSGSGDKISDWVLVFLLLTTAAFATGVWSFLDRHRGSYANLYKWFRLFLRFALAAQMLTYGCIKIIPLQMPYPGLFKLLEPYGDFSPMGVLWASVGASPHYETFAGCAELLAGILLIIPRTTLAGALVCLLDMTQVFTLNMTYDVPVKLLSFHLLLLSVFLLAPDLQRLACFLFSDRAVPPAQHPLLFQTVRANRIALAAQLLFGVALLGFNLRDARNSWYTYGGGGPKSPLYGIWNVEEFSIDGQSRQPLVADKDRWRRVVFDRPTFVAFQHMDETLEYFSLETKPDDHRLVLTTRRQNEWKANLTFQRLSQDQLTLDGDMDAHKVHMQLRLFDHKNAFPLVHDTFHWINEYPVNR